MTAVIIVYLAFHLGAGHAHAAAGTGAAARPQTLQYPSSIVPPQLVQVLIATVLPAVWIN